MDMEWGATRGQDLESRTRCKEGRRERGDSRQKMLAVVEHEQRLPGAEMVGQVLKDRAVRCRDDSERTGHRHRHEIRIAERGEIHPDHAIGKLIGNILRDGQRQPGLSDAPRTSQGQQRDGLVEEERTRGSALALPADEPGAGNGQRSEQGRCSRSDHAGIPSWVHDDERHSVPDSGNPMCRQKCWGR